MTLTLVPYDPDGALREVLTPYRRRYSAMRVRYMRRVRAGEITQAFADGYCGSMAELLVTLEALNEPGLQV
jgi:hypothetical protein